MMRSLLMLTATALVSVIPGFAAPIEVNFFGTVTATQGATGEAAGNYVGGFFILDDTTGQFSQFAMAGLNAPAGSTANNGLSFTDAIYEDQLSPVSSGGNVNSTFTVDLSSLTQWPVGVETIYTLLADSSQVPGNLDTSGDAFTSTFGYYMSDAAGNNVVSLQANITSITVTGTPEPAGLALLGGSFLGLGALLRRRRA